jgi:hypothetical protein
MKLVSESDVCECAIRMELTWGVLVGSSTFFLVPFGGMTVESGLVYGLMIELRLRVLYAKGNIEVGLKCPRLSGVGWGEIEKSSERKGGNSCHASKVSNHMPLFLQRDFPLRRSRQSSIKTRERNAGSEPQMKTLTGETLQAA